MLQNNIAKIIKDQTDSILRRRQNSPGGSVTIKGSTTEPGTGPGTPPAMNDPGRDLDRHKTSGDHDGRYYTEDEVLALLNFLGLSDTPDTYEGQNGKVLVVNEDEDGLEFGEGGGGIAEIPQATATELGGIKAATKTSGETQEVKIDVATGKLYSTPPTAAANGLPAGGTAGQVLSKIDGTNYNAQWIEPPSGGGGVYAWAFNDLEETIGEALAGSLSRSAYSVFTTYVSLGRILRLSALLWDVGVAETWELQIDGETIALAAVTTGAGTAVFDTTGVVVPAGTHSFSLVPAASAKMQYVSNLTYLDRWVRIEGWKELGGNYHPPLRLVGKSGRLVEIT